MRSVIFLILFLLFHDAIAQDVIIRGKASNQGGQFIILKYMPFFRGNPSFDGFKSIGSPIDEQGDFNLEPGKVTDAALYSLEYDSKSISFPLFKGDNIDIEFDGQNLKQTFFATGKGAGKINVFHLEDFRPAIYNPQWTAIKFSGYRDSLISAQLSLLEDIYKRNFKSKGITNSKNKNTINRIVRQSPLSKGEYIFLKDIIFMNRFELPMGSPDEIDFNSAIMVPFRRDDYAKIGYINYAYNQGKIFTILKAEYIRENFKNGRMPGYNTLDAVTGSSEAFEWMLTFMKENFSTGVHDKIFAEMLIWGMTLGSFDEKQYNSFKGNCRTEKYVDYIDQYRTALKEGEGASPLKSIFDANGFEALQDRCKNDNTLLVFWSAQYAGASVLDDLPIIDYLSEAYDLRVLYICVDEESRRSLANAKVRHSNWSGEHYFMATETNQATLKQYSSASISAFCYGGATYAILGKDGFIHSKIEFPGELAAGKIARYLKP